MSLAPRPVLAVTCLAGAFALGCGPQAQTVESNASQLRTIEVGEGVLPFVLLHGYGSSAEEWLPFTYTIRLPEGRRFVLPVGPEATAPPDGPRGGRAWWHLGLASLRRPSDGLPDLSRQAPPGLVESTVRIRRLLDELAARGGYPRDRQMVAGYSQGAMIAANTAFTTAEPMEALILLSGTFVNEDVWRAGMPRRRGLRVFVSHGRRDEILPFDAADRLQRAMRDAGLRVSWVPFDGGHEMPATVVRALNDFLEGGSAPQPRGAP